MTPQPIACSFRVFPRVATAVSQGRPDSEYWCIGSGTTCGPYLLAPCAYHVAPSTVCPVCPSSGCSTPSLYACSESSCPKAYSVDTQNSSASYSLSTVQEIQKDMMQYGSITGCQSCHSRLVPLSGVSTDCRLNLGSVCGQYGFLSTDACQSCQFRTQPRCCSDVSRGVASSHRVRRRWCS